MIWTWQVLQYHTEFWKHLVPDILEVGFLNTEIKAFPFFVMYKAQLLHFSWYSEIMLQ